jgi:hypothetical protein
VIDPREIDRAAADMVHETSWASHNYLSVGTKLSYLTTMRYSSIDRYRTNTCTWREEFNDIINLLR